jgi:allantoin racemase
MPRRINFINPFGTTAYDDLIIETLSHYAMDDTKLEVTHLEGCPADMDYFYPKHMVEGALFEAVKKSEEDGYDAVISGCCYDPGVMVSRELVNIPVVGPFEACLSMLSYYGRTAVIVTDHVKAGSQMKDNVKLYGASERILGLDVINWYVKDMVLDTSAVAQDVVSQTAKSVERTGAEAVILNCTIIAASYQKYLMNGGKPAPFPILNPNLMALSIAESLANLHQKGSYQVSRLGYYAQPKDSHFQKVQDQTRNAWRNAEDGLVSSYAAK